MKKIIKTGLLLASFSLVLTICHASDFELVKTNKNISVYERWIKHNGNTVRELKVDFTAHASSTAKVIALLKDPSKETKWNMNAKSFRIAHTNNDAVWLSYVRYDIPWPMSDQDCSLKYYFNKSELNNPVCNIYFEGIKTEKFPIIKDVTRITGTKGKWMVEKTKSGNLKITYQIVTDKSASVPRWISDPIIHDNIITTMSAFRKLLEQSV